MRLGSTNVEIRDTIALNQVSLEKILELAEGVKTQTQLEGMLLVAVKQLCSGYRELLDSLADRVK